MTRYRYTAIDQYGHRQRGLLEVADEQALMASLQQQGLELLTFKSAQSLLWRQPRVNTQTLILFCVQMEQLLQAGVPLLQSVAELTDQSEHRGMMLALQGVQRHHHHAVGAEEMAVVPDAGRGDGDEHIRGQPCQRRVAHDDARLRPGRRR